MIIFQATNISHRIHHRPVAPRRLTGLPSTRRPTTPAAPPKTPFPLFFRIPSNFRHDICIIHGEPMQRLPPGRRFPPHERVPHVTCICSNLHQLHAAKPWRTLAVSLAPRQMAGAPAASLTLERYPNFGSDRAI